MTLMAGSILILTAERDRDDGLIVTFSDGTTGAYVAEELLELRPFRERTKTKTTTAALAQSVTGRLPQKINAPTPTPEWPGGAPTF
jgi:hypothetical protein